MTHGVQQCCDSDILSAHPAPHSAAPRNEAADSRDVLHFEAELLPAELMNSQVIPTIR